MGRLGLTYTLLYILIKQVTNEDLLYSTGNATRYSAMTYMRNKSRRVDICITESLAVHLKLIQRCKLIMVVVVQSLSLVQLLIPPGPEPARLPCLWNSPGKNTRAGCHFLLQGILPIQGLNPHLLHWQASQVDSFLLSHEGGPKVKKSTVLQYIKKNAVGLQVLMGISETCYSRKIEAVEQ